jgi:hypothetical protein
MTHQEAYHTDPTVHKMIQAGNSYRDITCALVVEKQRLQKRIVELTTIAPKKFKQPDGTFRVWQCPVELIPEEPAT